MLQVSQTSTDPVNNLQHLLRLPIFNKTTLVAFHLHFDKETTITGFYQKEKSESTHDLDSLLVITNNDFFEYFHFYK
jgi:hypothetical protein